MLLTLLSFHHSTNETYLSAREAGSKAADQLAAIERAFSEEKQRSAAAVKALEAQSAALKAEAADTAAELTLQKKRAAEAAAAAEKEIRESALRAQGAEGTLAVERAVWAERQGMLESESRDKQEQIARLLREEVERKRSHEAEISERNKNIEVLQNMLKEASFIAEDQRARLDQFEADGERLEAELAKLRGDLQGAQAALEEARRRAEAAQKEHAAQLAAAKEEAAAGVRREQKQAEELKLAAQKLSVRWFCNLKFEIAIHPPSLCGRITLLRQSR